MTAPTTDKLLSDLKTTTQAVQNKDWLGAGAGGLSAGLDILGATGSPLSAIAEAGFGFIMPLVSFLNEPLQLLSGNPGSISSTAQGLQSTGQSATALAGRYQQAATDETSGWSGTAASGYQNTSTQASNGIEALGQASTATAGAVSGAGQVVAQCTQDVTELIGEATSLIITIMTQASASSESTFGGSMAAAIPQVVGVATQYGSQIMAKLQALMSDAQKLMSLVQSITQAVTSVDQAIKQLMGSGGQSQPGSGSDTSPSTASPSDTSPSATSPSSASPLDTSPPTASPSDMSQSGTGMPAASPSGSGMSPSSMSPFDSGMSPAGPSPASPSDTGASTGAQTSQTPTPDPTQAQAGNGTPAATQHGPEVEVVVIVEVENGTQATPTSVA